MNNLEALNAGYNYRLEVSTANLMRSAARFAITLTEAKRIKKELAEVGYRVTIFAITNDGGLRMV